MEAQIVLMLLFTVVNTDTAASAIKARSKEYSTRSWPSSWRQRFDRVFKFFSFLIGIDIPLSYRQEYGPQLALVLWR
jgi:hypothetical protein